MARFQAITSLSGVAVLPSFMRRGGAVLLVVVCMGAAACSIDALLEAKIAPEVKLAVNAQSSEVPVNLGTTATLDASITRLGDYHGDVAFSVVGLPESIQAELGMPTTLGQVTSVTITFRVGAGTVVGDYVVTIRGTGGATGNAATQVLLRVTAVPSIVLTLTRPSLTIIRGGIARLGVTIARTNAPGPVALSFLGASGITLDADSSTVTGSRTTLTVVVAPSVAPGTYPLTLRAAATGVANRDVPFSITVPPEPLQLIMDSSAALQASVVSTSFIVNRNGVTGPLTFTTEGLPTGVTGTFQGGEGTTASLTLTVKAATPTGPAALTIRGRSAGGEEVSAVMMLTVGASNVGVTLAPPNVTLIQGTSVASTVTLNRTSYAGVVAVQTLNLPAGISVAVSNANVTGNSTLLTVSAASSLAPGTYAVTVRAVPSPSNGGSGPALDPAVATLAITVVESPPGNGNVVLDWSGCSAPDWVAAQDGTGPWSQLVGVQGRYRFGVNSQRGAYAIANASGQITVRFGTLAELTAASINMCPPPPPVLHNVVGTAQHSGPAETATWRLGGGVGTSSFAAQSFTIFGVAEGAHDLVGIGVSAFGTRMHISRDVVASEGESVGAVALVGGNSHGPLVVNSTFSGFTNETAGYTMSYLTGATCDVAELYTGGSTSALNGNSTISIFGLPAAAQRSTDYHMFEASGRTSTTRRVVSVSYQAMTPGRIFALPPALTATVANIAGSYRRLRVSFATALPSNYNGVLTFTYSDGPRATVLTASVASLGTGIPTLELPDFGGVTGFPMSAAVPLNNTGTFTVSVTGSNGQPLCSEESRRVSWNRFGTF